MRPIMPIKKVVPRLFGGDESEYTDSSSVMATSSQGGDEDAAISAGGFYVMQKSVVFFKITHAKYFFWLYFIQWLK